MNEEAISASIVICAYTPERWALLVESVESARVQPGSPQVIVVIDHEPSLLVRVRDYWPELTVVANASQPGLSGARNTGIAAANGDVIAFLDDDAHAASDWLPTLLTHFDDPSLVAVGGSAVPDWERQTRAAFLPPELYWVVGCSHRGLPTSVAEVRNVIGSSMAFRRTVLVANDGFSLGIGRVGALPLGCEETELCIRIRQADPTVRIVLDPNAVVQHRVSADRTTWRYLRRRSYFEGISKAVLASRLGSADALASEMAYTRRVLPRAVLRELSSGQPDRAAAIVLSLCVAGFGYLRGRLGRPGHTVGLPVASITRIPEVNEVT